MNVASMVVRVRVLREISGKWIDPGARTDQVLSAVQTGAVCVRAPRSKLTATDSVASEVARVCRCRGKRMLAPGLTDLLEPLGVIIAATHSVKVLWNKRMVIARQCK